MGESVCTPFHRYTQKCPDLFTRLDIPLIHIVYHPVLLAQNPKYLIIKFKHQKAVSAIQVVHIYFLT